MATTIGKLEEHSLAGQGYDYSPTQLGEIRWGLRFTPAVCMAGALVGLFSGQAWIHFTLAALGVVPFWLPAGHPLDVFYNRILRPLWRGAPLPPNPLPRRIACLLGGMMNLGIGLAFLRGSPALAYALGAMLIPLQIVVITTHFCVASWLYGKLLAFVGTHVPLVDPAEARRLVAQGARLIDVRSAALFAASHLPGAQNIPLEALDQHLPELRQHCAIVYCQRGFLSQIAARKLRRRGCERVYNLGAMERYGPPTSSNP
jgi:rhodanese-related sulfurtransferase